MIIWIASYPRSGNTYFRRLLKHFYGIQTFSIYKEKASPKHFEFQGNILKPEFLKCLVEAPELYFFKTHELPKEDFPAIYLVRDGRDALLSYAWYTFTFEGDEVDVKPEIFYKTLRLMIVEDRFFGGWGSHVLGWTQRHTPTSIVKFEELIRNPAPLNIVKEALSKIGLQPVAPMTTLSLPSFQELHNKKPQFYRKGQIGNWEEEMSYELQYMFWKKHGKAMQKIGYGKPLKLKPMSFLVKSYLQIKHGLRLKS